MADIIARAMVQKLYKNAIYVPYIANESDSSARIQAALDQARDLGGATVVVQDGTYNIGTPLKIYSYTRLVSSSKVIYLRSSSSIDNMIRSGVENASGYNGGQFIEIIGGVWDGNRASFTTNCTIIGFSHCQNMTLQDVIVQNVPGAYHGMEVNASKRVRIINCKFYHLKNVDGTYGSEMIQLDSATAGGFPWYGSFDNTTCDDILIEDCHFEDGVTGIGSHYPGVKHKDIRILNCHFENIKTKAIDCYNYENVQIKGCFFNNIYEAIVIEVESTVGSNTSKFQIEGNVFTNINMGAGQPRAIRATGLNGGLKPVNGIVRGNMIDTVGSHAIGFDFCDGWIVEDNIVTAAGGVGIYNYQSTHVMITGNRLTNNTGIDIQVGATSGSLTTTDCIVQGNQCDDIKLSFADRVILNNNVIATAVTVDAGVGAYQKLNNYIANVWTP